MSEALANCPFCGSVAEISLHDGDAGTWIARCPSRDCSCWPSTDCLSYEKAIAAWNRRAPTSAAGATKPDELTSSPDPAPALRAAEWVESANRLAEELETAAILYGDSAPDSLNERMCQHRMSSAREALHAHLSRASGLLPVAREGLSERQRRIINFAVQLFVNRAHAEANAAAQDKEGRHYKPGACEAFFRDAEDGTALLQVLRSAPASGDAPGEAK